MSGWWSMLTDRARAAIAYAEAGHRVFPMAVRDDGQGRLRKKFVLPKPANGGWRNENPALGQDPDKGGCHQATNDVRIVEAWWRERPRAGIGYWVPLDRIVCDIDSDYAMTRLWAGWPDAAEAMMTVDAFVVTTPRGTHFHFRVDREVRQMQNVTDAGCIQSCMDIRACGRGLVLLPPTGQGRLCYEAVSGSLDAPAECPAPLFDELTKLPPPRVRRLVRAQGGGVDLSASAEAPRTGLCLDAPPFAADGGKHPPRSPRHTVLFPRACAMREQGWERDVALAHILAENECCWEEPKEEDLLTSMVDDVWRRYSGGMTIGVRRKR